MREYRRPCGDSSSRSHSRTEHRFNRSQPRSDERHRFNRSHPRSEESYRFSRSHPRREERYRFNTSQPRSINKCRPRMDRVAHDVLQDITARFNTNIGPSPSPEFMSPKEGPEFIFDAVPSPTKSARFAQQVMTPRPKFAVSKLNRTLNQRHIDEEAATDCQNNIVLESDPEVEIVHVKLSNRRPNPKLTWIKSERVEEANDCVIILDEVPPLRRQPRHRNIPRIL
uniref:Transformer n=1 Tax=Steinernema glaseri TaxID=37863 RepID=A0A1I7XZS8_9BILA